MKFDRTDKTMWHKNKTMAAKFFKLLSRQRLDT